MLCYSAGRRRIVVGRPKARTLQRSMRRALPCGVGRTSNRSCASVTTGYSSLTSLRVRSMFISSSLHAFLLSFIVLLELVWSCTIFAMSFAVPLKEMQLRRYKTLQTTWSISLSARLPLSLAVCMIPQAKLLITM